MTLTCTMTENERERLPTVIWNTEDNFGPESLALIDWHRKHHGECWFIPYPERAGFATSDWMKSFATERKAATYLLSRQKTY